MDIQYKRYFFQKNFKFKIHIQRKKILNFIPSTNKIPKITGGKNIITKIKSKLKKGIRTSNENIILSSFLVFLRNPISIRLTYRNFRQPK